MIKCVCLVVQEEERILLVQARHRQKYYFPGGKIDEGETHKQALHRELQEELQIHIPEASLHYITTVVGDAYPQKNTKTELNCFYTTEKIDWSNIKPAQEITDLKWIYKTDREIIAPAVLTWLDNDFNCKLEDRLEFEPYGASLFDDVLGINIAESDLQFTKTPQENIKLAKEDLGRHPTLIYNQQQQCIGFFTLHEGQGVEPYTANPNAIFFRSFSIGVDYRGQGYGKQVIQQLPQYVKQYFPSINEIYLTVNDDNEKAQQLYKHCQYEYLGESLLEDRPVYIMRYRI
ncbi:GNAT family N-acetyltransferase [Staphylococcus succinus]